MFETMTIKIFNKATLFWQQNKMCRIPALKTSCTFFYGMLWIMWYLSFPSFISV